MARKCSRSRSPRNMTTLPSIPELEPLDADGSDNQAEAQTVACEAPEDLMSLWCYTELLETLHALMLSIYAEPFMLSSSSMNLQAILKRLKGGKYANNVDMFWTDVDACWACSESTFAGPERCDMATEMRALAERLELDFWNRFSELEQCPPMIDEEVQLGSMVIDSWVLDKAADFGEWLYGGVM